MNKKRKVIFLITILSGVICLINGMIKLFFSLYLKHKFDVNVKDASAVGIIGGADGPTTILVSSIKYAELIYIIPSFITVAGVVYLVMTKKKA